MEDTQVRCKTDPHPKRSYCMQHIRERGSQTILRLHRSHLASLHKQWVYNHRLRVKAMNLDEERNSLPKAVCWVIRHYYMLAFKAFCGSWEATIPYIVNRQPISFSSQDQSSLTEEMLNWSTWLYWTNTALIAFWCSNIERDRSFKNWSFCSWLFG